VEKDPNSFERLKQAVASESGMDAIEPLEGQLHERVHDVLRFVAGGFALFFIDPTGWRGVGPVQLGGLLKHEPGEVIINFMTDFINRRFQSDEDLDALFGLENARAELDQRGWTEAAAVALYCERLRVVGGFSYVTNTRIKKPLAERTYFHLVYGTRHPEGVKTFRAVEKKFMTEQKVVRSAAKQAKRIERTKQEELFTPAQQPDVSFEDEREQNLRLAESALLEHLRANGPTLAGVLVPTILQIPLVWETDLNEITIRLRKAGKLKIDGQTGRQRALRDEMVLRLAKGENA
jgi:hypothetical protein